MRAIARKQLISHIFKEELEIRMVSWQPQAFEKLKTTVASVLVLGLPDFEKPFKVHTNASDKVIGGVLVQKWYPIAFESQKLNDVE